jgi:aminoglycoside 2'-N-acetyltransferase I
VVSLVRRVASPDLLDEELRALRAVFDAAWPDEGDRLTEEDWHHSFGGIHFLIERGGTIVSHASVVPRHLRAGGRVLATGYVEAVATLPQHRRRGLATAALAAAADHIDRTFQLGALATGIPTFYERLGWQLWNGSTSVLTYLGERRTPQDDGAVLIHLTPSTPPLDPSTPITCDWRPGDPW